MLKDIVEKPIEIRDYFSSEATNLLRKLLDRNPERRLGSSPAGARDIMNHPFFKSINWDQIRNKEHKPIFKPKVKGEFDTGRIDKLFTKEEPVETLIDPNRMGDSEKQKAHFDNFTY